MASSIDASTSGVGGVITTADNTGILQLKTAGVVAVTVNASSALGVGTSPSYGTSGQVLTSAGSSAAPTWSTVSVPTTYKTRLLTSGTSYTVPTGVKSFYVFVHGATGGRDTSVGQGGVGGAGYSEKYYTSGFTAGSTTYTYAIGAGGTTSGTSGGTTSFGVVSVTGSVGQTSTTGTSGGVGSGGDFNATGGTGGGGSGNNGNARGGGGGGSGSRAGNGGTGSDYSGFTAGAGGGSGGNNASGSTGGIAATTKAAGALTLSSTLGTLIETFNAGSNAGSLNGGSGANSSTTQDIIFIWQVSGSSGSGGSGTSTSGGTGSDGKIVIIELY
jgi:hypothetical protein